MRVGVEAIGLEDHHSVGLQDRVSELSSISPDLFQALRIAKRCALDPLHDQDGFATHFAQNAWDRDGIVYRERAADCFEIAGFGDEVGLGAQQGSELVEDSNGVVGPNSGRKARDQACQCTERPDVGINISADPGTAYLHRDTEAIAKSSPVHLSYRPAGSGCHLECREKGARF